MILTHLGTSYLGLTGTVGTIADYALLGLLVLLVLWFVFWLSQHIGGILRFAVSSVLVVALVFGLGCGFMAIMDVVCNTALLAR